MKTSRTWLSASVLLAALVGIVLYWPTIRLPLIYDDLLHIRIAKGLDLANVWLPTGEFGFYRPLTFFPLILIKELFGYYPSELLHGINVIQHALNAALLVALSWRLWRNSHRAVAAGLLFVLFPFSFQAVAVYGHNVHPATAGLLLLALHTYLSGIRAKRRAYPWWIATVLVFVASLLSHESAVLFGVFAALIHWNDREGFPGVDLRKPKSSFMVLGRQPWFAFLAAGVVYAVGYQFLDLSRAPQASFTGGASWYKFLYLGQGAAYPLTWLGRWIPETEPAVTVLVLAGLAVMIALTVWSARQKVNRLPLLLGWGWWALASILIALTLDTSYLLHGPRLLYLSSVGLAFLWPVLMEPIFQIKRYGRPIWATGLVALLAVNWIFVRDRLNDYAQLTSSVEVVEETLKGRPSGEGVVLVNLPQWLDDTDNYYQVGIDLVAMMGDYLFVEELITENLAVNHPASAILVPDLLRQPDYRYGIHEEPAGEEISGNWAPLGGHLFTTSYMDDGPESRYMGMIAPESEGEQSLATLGPYDLLEASASICDGVAELSTRWRIAQGMNLNQPIRPTTSIFAQLLDGSGQIIDQRDGPLLDLPADLLNLKPGKIVIDVRELQATDVPPGPLLIGVYDYADGTRYAATDSQGRHLENSALEISLGDCS
jgi:hypothetical protein